MKTKTIQRALLSVSDKTHLLTLAQALQTQGVEIISTGGTAKHLIDNNISVIELAAYTGFPEIMGGRVKTLHPKVFAGLLARGEQDDTVLAEHEIPVIDLVVVNLYPFVETIKAPGCDFAKAIENIDIGGPSMLRAAAKNFAHTTVLCDPNDYATFIEEFQQQGQVSLATRQRCAQKVFAHTYAYDSAIADYLAQQAPGDERDIFQPRLHMPFHKQHDLRYGENPHQAAALYVSDDAAHGSLATSKQLQGKACSYNNYLDADTALYCVQSQTAEHACVIVKHANPCGIACAENATAAYQRAFATDPVSSFGGIIAFNCGLDAATAKAIVEQQFAEVILAPSVTEEALQVLQSKPNLRVLQYQKQASITRNAFEYKSINGGLLVQQSDIASLNDEQLKIVTDCQPSPAQLADLHFAWQAVKFIKSNAIVYAKDLATVAIGAGQMSRVFSAKIATLKAADAELSLQGSVIASDAFFPFKDSIEIAADLGISAIIQPGGSIRDEEVIQAANAAGIAMVFTGMRHFRH